MFHDNWVIKVTSDRFQAGIIFTTISKLKATYPITTRDEIYKVWHQWVTSQNAKINDACILPLLPWYALMAWYLDAGIVLSVWIQKILFYSSV
jgi:hypothetical protein